MSTSKGSSNQELFGHQLRKLRLRRSMGQTRLSGEWRRHHLEEGRTNAPLSRLEHGQFKEFPSILELRSMVAVMRYAFRDPEVLVLIVLAFGASRVNEILDLWDDWGTICEEIHRICVTTK